MLVSGWLRVKVEYKAKRMTCLLMGKVIMIVYVCIIVYVSLNVVLG